MSKRNEPCPCGSGIKFKKCCLLKIREQEAVMREYNKALRLAQAPCPCKSGKKFGECCLHKHDPRKTELKRVV
jgi:uncharacterized protein YecA (UPF0149 family)